MKTKIAFLLNLERPITATAKAWQPGLPSRWNLQGEDAAAMVISFST